MRKFMRQQLGDGRELRYVTTVTQSHADPSVRFNTHTDATVNGRPIDSFELRQLLTQV